MYKKYFASGNKLRFLFGLLHFKYAKIWLLCYGIKFIISVSEIYKLKMPLWSDMPQSKSVSFLRLSAAMITNVFTLFLTIVVAIIPFDMLANRCAHKLYRFCGQLIIGIILFGIIVVLVAESLCGILSDAGLVLVGLYVIFYDLWYIAADILNCDGMDVTSTRIYVLGFNFVVACMILSVTIIYYAISNKEICWWKHKILFVFVFIVGLSCHIFNFNCFSNYST